MTRRARWILFGIDRQDALGGNVDPQDSIPAGHPVALLGSRAGLGRKARPVGSRAESPDCQLPGPLDLEHDHQTTIRVPEPDRQQRGAVALGPDPLGTHPDIVKILAEVRGADPRHRLAGVQHIVKTTVIGNIGAAEMRQAELLPGGGLSDREITIEVLHPAPDVLEHRGTHAVLDPSSRQGAKIGVRYPFVAMVGKLAEVGSHPGNLDHLVEVDRKSTRLNSSHGYISYAV